MYSVYCGLTAGLRGTRIHSVLPLILDTLVLAACLVWSGGLLVVGAVVAPVIFRSGNPQAGELMTQVFSRFDRVAVALAVLVLACEAASLFWGTELSSRQRMARALAALVMTAAVAAQSAYFTPELTRLYRSGVRRNVGAEGARFDQIHRASSMSGRIGIAAALALTVLVVVARSQPSHDGDSEDQHHQDR